MTDIEHRLVEMSKLIQNVTTLVSNSLREVESERGDRAMELERDRQSRKGLLAVVIVFTVVNIIFGVMMIREMRTMVDEIHKVQISQFEHRVSSGLTDAQVQALIDLVERNAASTQMKEDLKKIGAMRPDDRTIQRAAAAAVIEGVPPKEVAKDLLPPSDAGTVDSKAKDARHR